MKGKAKAIAFMATREHDILYRHTNSGAGEIDRLPMVIVAREDGERIARLLASRAIWCGPTCRFPTRSADRSKRQM